MKSVKEKSEEYLQQEKDEILCLYDRYAGYVDGANYVLEQIESLTKYNRWSAQDLYELIEQLKSNQ